MYYRFLFQESRIWEAGDPVDPNGAVQLINAKNEAKARRKLPKTSLGRKWVLVSKEAK